MNGSAAEPPPSPAAAGWTAEDEERVTEAVRDAVAQRTWEQSALCPNGCGCRKQTNDPEWKDCACDGPCCMAEDWWDGRSDAEVYAAAALAEMQPTAAEEADRG